MTPDDKREFWVGLVADIANAGNLNYETLWGISIVDFFTILKRLKKKEKKNG